MSALKFPVKLKTFLKEKSGVSSNSIEKSIGSTVISKNISKTFNDSYKYYTDIIGNHALTNYNDLTNSDALESTSQKKRRTNRIKPSRSISTYSNVSPTRAFHYAEADDDISFRILLEKGLDINMKDSFGWSLLMVAACANSQNMVKKLLNEGAATDIEDPKGNTAHSLAVAKCHKSVINMLETYIDSKCGKKYKVDVPKITKYQQEKNPDGVDTIELDIFCGTCKKIIKNTIKKEHDCSICHLFNLGPGSTRPSYVIPVSNKGYQLLVDQGWDSKAGLGPAGTGKLYPIKTALKRDKTGIGHKNITEKITHFNPGDVSAVERRVKRRTRSRKEIISLKRKDKLKEFEIRESLIDL